MPYIATDESPDLVQELRLRRWARENFVPIEFRDDSWEACVLDEMSRKDQELLAAAEYAGAAQRIVPLVPEQRPALRGPHHDVSRSHVLARVPFVE